MSWLHATTGSKDIRRFRVRIPGRTCNTVLLAQRSPMCSLLGAPLQKKSHTTISFCLLYNTCADKTVWHGVLCVLTGIP
eukprot:scaffold46817_cov54-Attheya_sp.AAC.2